MKTYSLKTEHIEHIEHISDHAGDVAICYITQLPVGEQECPLGKDECDDCCEEYFLAYSG